MRLSGITGIQTGVFQHAMLPKKPADKLSMIYHKLWSGVAGN